MTDTTTHHFARAIEPGALKELRDTDDAGRPCAPFTDDEGGAPLRCCLRRSEPGERIALVSYAPLRRWAAQTGADPGAYDEQGPVFLHAEECGGPSSGAGHHSLTSAGSLRVVRRYSAAGRILGGRLIEVPGPADATDAAFEAAFHAAFTDPDVALVHIRAVEYGCFFYEVRRP
ncbi:DUF1203 domain-containing protein [Streptomyces sp. NPDC059786]|uniref:DUF1203 domain-containing protein n=1 Tax=Streptomyces sp. NPDC059786 TaxID=3346946 RepID=UPI00365E8E5B